MHSAARSAVAVSCAVFALAGPVYPAPPDAGPGAGPGVRWGRLSVAVAHDFRRVLYSPAWRWTPSCPCPAAKWPSGALRVSAGGTEKAASPVLRAAGPAWSLTADVTGADYVELVASDGGDGNGNDHADWGAAASTAGADHARRAARYGGAARPD